MTREQQRQIKEAKLAYRNACRLEKKTEKQEKLKWEHFEKRMKERGAWIEETDPNGDDKQFN